MTQLLHQLGYVYKKLKLIPGKANAEQKNFVERYQNLKVEKAPGDPIYFMDATHPHHITRSPDMDGSNVVGNMEFAAIRSGNQRININGAIDCVGLYPIIRYDATINAQSAVALLQQIELQHPNAHRM